jgi:hypothetical protein
MSAPPQRTTLLLAAYAAGAVGSAILLYPHFDFFRNGSDTDAEAIGGFVTAGLILAGVAPLGLWPVMALLGMARRRGAGARSSQAARED